MNAAQLGELRLDGTRAGERRDREVVVVERLAIRPSGVDRKQRPALLLRVELAQAFLVAAILDVEHAAPHGIEEIGDDADDARGVEHVHRLAAVGRRDPHRGVLP